MKKIPLLIAFLFFGIFKVYSQALSFKHVSVKEGLVSNMVHAVLQDSDGFMWFGTEDGLCRYDGYSFLNFFQSPKDSLSLTNNLILSLAEDKSKQLWIGTHQGLNMLDLETYKITRFNHFFKEKLGFFTIETLYLDAETLWVGTDNSGLFSLNIHTYQVKHYSHQSKNKNSLSSNTINAIVRDPQKGLLIATSRGLDALDKKTSSFIHYLEDVYISDVHLKKNGNVLLGVLSKAPYYLKFKKDLSFEKIKIPVDFTTKEVRFFSGSEDRIWISIRDHGLVCIDEQTQKTYRLQYNKNNTSGINSNTITNVFEDSFGNIWMSSFDAGLNILEKERKNFVHIKDNYLPNGLQNNRVRSMYQDSDGDIWIGTKVNGTLSRFCRDSLTFIHYHSNPLKENMLSNDYVFSIIEDRPGYLWVGTLNGLNYFNKNTGEFKILKHQEGKNSLSSNSINTLLKDKDSLYIGTVTEGLDIYNTKTKIFSHYKKTGAFNQISDDRIKVIYKDSYDNIWIGTLNGLNLFDVKTGTFQQFLNNPLDQNSISESYILSIHEDTNQNLWIGTSLGINLMDRETNNFKVFTTKDGLAGNSVRGILEDEEGDLWLSTNNGLSKFNQQTKTFKNYNVYDGLQSNEFSKYVSCKTKNGEMLFGGTNGFTIFHPDEITDNTRIPKVLLTNFKLFHQSVPVNQENSPLTTHITKTNEIVLNYKQSVFSFEFVALNYSSPEKNSYAYKMEGFDKDWNDIGNKREAHYTNLDPGNYVFRVKASNNDGLWNETGTSVMITILPPPWKSWWATICYCIMLILFVLWIRNNVLKRNKEQKEREIDAMKIKFFANVSHEFRTPLTLILSPLEKLLKTNNQPEQKSQLRLMSRHAKRLLNLVNQLLDFQKIGSGELKLKQQAGDIVSFTKELSFLFAELSNEKNIDFQFQSDIDVLETMFDFDKMEKIIFNLVSNAFKFTPESGTVLIKISLEKNQNFIIQVKDNGIGIASDQQKNIFKRFYQADNSNTIGDQGSGIGLALVKEYVELHEGKITVESKIGIGSSFVFTIPFVKVDTKNKKNKTPDNINTSLIKEESGEEIKYKNKTPLVLIVEDHKDLREFLKTSLEVYYKVIEASNGVEGLQQAIDHLPNIIVSDVMMPKMNGNEFCSKVKNNPHTSHIPVILLTAQTSAEYEVEGFNSGADQYVTKPFSFDVLKSRINSLLEQRQSLQQIFSKKLEVDPSEITVTSIDEKLVRKALIIIEQNIGDSKYSVDDLSTALEISRGHLYRKINSIIGKSPSGFIRSIRLKRAAQLLRSSNLTIAEIAYKVGFSNPKYFSKCFKSEFDILPSQFAKNYKDDSTTAAKYT